MLRALKLFFQELIHHPQKMGAAWPSSSKLARKIAKQIIEKQAYVLELGPGTGVITREIIAQGVSPKNIILVEQSKLLADYLEQIFPDITVFQINAEEMFNIISPKFSKILTIVSSLPFQLMSEETIKKIGEQINLLLEENGIYIQYTYSLWHKPHPPSSSFKLLQSFYIVKNIPSARIDVFQKIACLP